MKNNCVECGKLFESSRNAKVCSESCRKKINKRRVYNVSCTREERKYRDIDKNYSPGEKIVVERNKGKRKGKEVLTVIKAYPNHLLCELKLRHRICTESFRYDQVKRVGGAV